MFNTLRKYINDLKLSGLYGKAHKMHMRENYKGALDILDIIMASNPPEYLIDTVLSERGEIDYRLGNYQGSIDSLEKFVSRVSCYSNGNKEIIKQIDRAKEFINAASSKT